MIIIGLEGCEPCKEFKAKHTELKYIEISRGKESKDSQEANLKKRLDKLGVKSYPTVLNLGMTRTVPLKIVDEQFAKDNDLL